MTTAPAPGTTVHVKGRPGAWRVVRNAGAGFLVIQRRGRITTAHHANTTPTKGKE